MSSLGSLLGQIEGGQPNATKTAELPARSRVATEISKQREHNVQRPQSATASASFSARPSSLDRTNSSNQVTQKRKAESPLNDSRPKVVRNEPVSGVRQVGTSSVPSFIATQPYKGTAGLSRPNLTSRPGVATNKSANIPQSINAPSKPSTAQPSPAATTSKNSAANGAAPKKGSYAEIMARASTVQAAPTGIKNKATESVKKTKASTPGAGTATATAGKPKAGGPSAVKVKPERPGAKAVSISKDTKPQEVKRKPVDLGYKGTARPAAPPAPAYKGTMGLKRPESANRDLHDRRDTSKSNAANKRYSYYDDEDEEEEDEDDCYSDASSDMEAGVFDVDREEEEALRAAKREDAQEQAKLEELERDKRRRKQLALAKSLAEKKERMRFM